MHNFIQSIIVYCRGLVGHWTTRANLIPQGLLVATVWGPLSKSKTVPICWYTTGTTNASDPWAPLEQALGATSIQDTCPTPKGEVKAHFGRKTKGTWAENFPETSAKKVQKCLHSTKAKIAYTGRSGTPCCAGGCSYPAKCQSSASYVDTRETRRRAKEGRSGN